MLVYGDLIAAGLEELESDPTTGLFSGRIYRNTTSGEVRVYSGSVWKTVVDRDTAQTLSAKTIDSSCSISSSLSLPVVAPSKGGTGVANNDAATLTRSGSHALTLTTTAPTSLTLPTTGTVATLSEPETLVNKVISSTAATTGGLKLPVGDNDTHRPTGTAAQLKGMIRYNDTEDVFEGYNEIGGWSAIGGGGTTDRITQAGHGFVVGDVLYLNGSVYTKAIASAANTAEVVGVVSKVIDASQFELTLSGEVSGLVAASFTEGTLPPVGEAVFLSGTVAGKLTITEPSVVGHVSLPVGVISEVSSATGRKMYVAIKRGSVVGATNARTQIPLSNNATTSVLNVSAYEAGELSGWVSISATTSLKFYVKAQFSKNGAGNNYNISYQTSGDTPPVGFVLQVTSAGLVQAVLPSITGFGSASITYGLDVAAVGATLPLSIDAGSITSGNFSRGVFTSPLQSTQGTIELGLGRPTDGVAFIDFTTQASEVDNNARIIKYAGTNTDLEIQNQGNGTISFRVAGVVRANFTSSSQLILDGLSPSANSGTVVSRGIAGRQGVSGSTTGNAINFWWSSPNLQAWIDGTNIGNLTYSSDYRIKKNIETQSLTAIDRVMALRPVKYEFSDYGELFKADGVEREGFIAHEVADVIPSAVDGEKDAEDQVQSLKLDAIVSVLTKAIQELKVELDSVKSELSALKAKN